MTDEEFLNEMFPYYEDMTDLEVLQTASRRVGAEKMAKWKEEQMIEKVCQWLKDNAEKYIYKDVEDWGEVIKLDIDDLTETFRKAMEE